MTTELTPVKMPGGKLYFEPDLDGELSCILDGYRYSIIGNTLWIDRITSDGGLRSVASMTEYEHKQTRLIRAAEAIRERLEQEATQ